MGKACDSAARICMGALGLTTCALGISTVVIKLVTWGGALEAATSQQERADINSSHQEALILGAMLFCHGVSTLKMVQNLGRDYNYYNSYSV